MEEYLQESLIEDKPKIYTKRAIEIGTFLGGPFVAGYLLYQNFITFGEPNKARNSLIIGTVLTFVLAGVIVYAPEGILDKVPNHIIPLFNGAIAYLLVRKYQAAQIEDYLAKGGHKASGWKVAGIALIGVAALLLPVTIFWLLNQSNTEGDVMKFGEDRIYYDASNVSAQQVEELGGKLSSLKIFGRNRPMVFEFKQTSNIYELSFPVKEGAWNNPEIINSGKVSRDAIQSIFSDKIIVLNFVYESFDSVKLTFGEGIITRPAK